MSTITKEFTKEQLIEHLRTRIEHRKGLIASMHIDRGYRDYLKLELRSSEIALASLEAEAAGIVRHIELRGPEHPAGIHVSLYSRLDDGIELYTAPPATVSVPEWTNKQCLEFLSIAFRHAEIKGDLELDDIRLGVKMVNGSRAAMLNQEKGNG